MKITVFNGFVIFGETPENSIQVQQRTVINASYSGGRCSITLENGNRIAEFLLAGVTGDIVAPTVAQMQVFLNANFVLTISASLTPPDQGGFARENTLLLVKGNTDGILSGAGLKADATANATTINTTPATDANLIQLLKGILVADGTRIDTSAVGDTLFVTPTTAYSEIQLLKGILATIGARREVSADAFNLIANPDANYSEIQLQKAIALALGKPSDLTATSNVGTFSLTALIKRLLNEKNNTASTDSITAVGTLTGVAFTLQSADANRKRMNLFNLTNKTLSISVGSTASATNLSYTLPPSTPLVLDEYESMNLISAIWSGGAAATGTVSIQIFS